MGKAINMTAGKLVNQENHSIIQYRPVICNFYSYLVASCVIAQILYEIKPIKNF